MGFEGIIGFLQCAQHGLVVDVTGPRKVDSAPAPLIASRLPATSPIAVSTPIRAVAAARLRSAAAISARRESGAAGSPTAIDFASRRALAVTRTNQRLAVVSIYKALGGGWEIFAQADHDCGGADGTSNLRFTKQVTRRP